MANVYQSTASLSARRAAYSSEEDKSMWNFYVQKVRKRNPDALARRASLWAEYAMTCNTKRTYQTLEKHFRDILLPRIDNAPIDDEDVILILELCKVSLADNDAQRNLKRRLRKLCELTINHPSLFVQRVTRLENRFQRPSNTAYNPPNYPPPVFVPDTQLPPTGTSIINKIIEKNSQEDEIVDDSFRCVNPDQPLGNDQGYLTFIQEVTLGRQQPFQPKETHFKTSSQKQPLKKTTSWSSVTSGEYLMDLSNSPVRLKTLTEEASENDDTIQQHYETAPSQPITPSTNSSPVVPDSEEAAQPSSQLSNVTAQKEEMELTLTQEDQLASTSNASTDQVTQLELQWHKQLTQKNRDNKGVTPMQVLQCKELLRSRIKLTAKGLLPADSLLDEIPDNVKDMVAEFDHLLKWCLSDTPSPTKSI